ncbi:MAG: pyridoxal phosphate-dependent aminotransferase [Alkalispirochaeta sp.]
MSETKSPADLGADRLSTVPFSGIRRVFDAVKKLEDEGRDVIHWQIGRTDFDSLQTAKDAAAASMQRGEVHYAPNRGVPALRKAIAARAKIDSGLDVDQETQVIVMAGANEGIMVSMMAFINPGDEVIIPNPNWHHYKSTVALAGGVPVEVETSEKDNFSLKAELVAEKITPRTKMICVTSPGNPTGCTEPMENLKAIAELAIRHNLIVISDEIYNRIYFGDGETSPTIYSLPGMAERTIVINGFSKTYSMDGWRLGWTVASPELTMHLLKIRQYTTVCVNTFIQHGAAAALSGDQTEIDKRIAEFGARRKIIVEGLQSIPGVTLAVPDGAFYAFPNLSAFGKSSKEIADYLLFDHGIATVAGSVFGSAGEGHVRIAYSCSTEECERGIERLRSALEALG